MHLQISTFLSRFVREAGVRTMAGRRVVEIGSYDLNGSAREVLQPGTASYVGVDWREGPGVDVVSLGHAYQPEPGQWFDVAVSCQALEHDPHWRATLARLVKLVASPDRDGWVIVTCAGPGYVPHELDTAPPWPGRGAEPWYENRTMAEVRDALAVAAIVQGCDVSVYATSDREGLDVLVWAHLRPAQPDARTPPEIQRRLRDWYTRHDKADLDDRVRALLWAMAEQEGLELAGCLLGLSSGLAGDHDLGGRWWARLSRLVVREHGASIDSADLVYAALTMGLVPLDDAELTAWQRAGLRVAVKAGMAHRGEVATWEAVVSGGESREVVGPRELPCIGCDDEG